MAPECLSTGTLGRNADTWAMGLMATRALTEYFPFDDVLSAFLLHTVTLTSSVVALAENHTTGFTFARALHR